jgi:hypothetical protein
MRKPEKPTTLAPLTTPAQRQAAEEGEQRRQEYLATLDPRQREQLDPVG